MKAASTARNGKVWVRPQVVIGAAVLMVASVCGIALSDAGAQKVFNPGPFNLKVTGGSILISATDFDLTPSDSPACSDGEDNDDDGATDFPADAQCSSATDNSEVASGFQPKEDTTISGTIAANGAITVPQSGIYFPPAYLAASGAVITASIQPTTGGSGNLNPLTGAANVSVTVRVKLTGSPSGVDLGSNCIIGPLTLALTTGTTAPPGPNTPITGVPYDPSTGIATMVNNSFSVPGASGCGAFGIANGSINSQLGLPSPAGKNTAILTGTVNPIIGKGVDANLSASATTGPAPLTVNFNGTGSVSAKPISSYAWDFGNGQTATGSTAFTTYPTAGTYTSKLTITDTDGDTDTEQVAITVGDPVNVAPTASIGTSGATGFAPLSVSFDGSASSDPDGSISSYAWNLGNGQTSTSATPVATYNSAGTYTATLTVTDNRGGTGTASQTITVNQRPNVAPTAVIGPVSYAGTIPRTVTLSASSSTDSDGSIAGYAWDFGNGQTASGPSAVVTYPTAGTYTITLTATDNQGATGTQTLVVEVSSDPNIAPTASATASTNSGVAPLSVTFNGTGSTDSDGLLVGYSWNFGNGQSSSSANPTVTYSVPGTYVATLTVTDNKGATGAATATVVVAEPANVAPTAQASATPATGTAPLLVQLSSAGSSDPDGSISGYAWAFGNGQTSTSPSPSAIYSAAGTYTATLTVTDNKGATAAKSVTVTVIAANVAPVANIVATPTVGSAPLVVNVNGAGSSDADGSIVSYAWEFNNGQTATGPTAQTTYTTTGSFTIKLTVTDNRGTARSTTKVIAVSGSNLKPIAVLSALPTSGPAPLLVQLSAVGSSDPDGSVFSYGWDFGNGQTAAGLRTQVNYTVPGTYLIKLTVTDNKGATGTSTETVVVDPPLTVKDRVRLQFTGQVSYVFDGPIQTGNLRVSTDASGLLEVSGTATYVGPNSSTATVTVQLGRFLWFNAFSGSVTVNDPANGVNNVSASMFLSSLSRPSATSARGTASGFDSQFRGYGLAFTIDDRI